METGIARRKRGQRLSKAERDDLIIELVKHLAARYDNTHQLAKRFNVDETTIDRLRPVVDKIIANSIPDRNIIRSLEISRTYEMMGKLADMFEKAKPENSKLNITHAMLGWSKHMALITGLNVETKVNVNQKQLVITRAHPDAVKKALNGHEDIERIQIESERVIKNL